MLKNGTYEAEAGGQYTTVNHFGRTYKFKAFQIAVKGIAIPDVVTVTGDTVKSKVLGYVVHAD